MKIEEAIRQTRPFASVHQKMLVNLLFTAHHFQYLSNELFGMYDISWQQFNALRILRGSHPKPLSLKDIRERMIDKTCDVSRLIDRLEKKSLVERHTCPNDMRKSEVNITAKGLDLLTEIQANQEVQPEHVCGQLSEKEADNLSDLLDKLRG